MNSIVTRRTTRAFCMAAAISLALPTLATAAQNPWGMFKNTADRTGATTLPGAQSAKIQWKGKFNEGTQSGAVVAADGSIYIGSQSGYLYAYSATGTLKWKYKLGRNRVTSVPAIGADGTVYASAENGKLTALSAAGALKWQASISGYGGPSASPVIGSDGTIYAGADTFYAFNPNGVQKWSYNTGSSMQGPAALAGDGTIYFPSNNRLYALNADGSLKWRFSVQGTYGFGSAPAIGADGSVYINTNDGVLYSISASGLLNWKYSTDGIVADVPSSPVVGPDGTIYFGGAAEYVDTGGGYVFALSAEGKLKWRNHVGCSMSAPALDGNGTLYITNNECGTLFAISASTGVQLWKYADATIYLRTPPAIGPQQNVYVGILPYQGTSGGLLSFGP
jgi:outer membrane protein assembly factor BamB